MFRMKARSCQCPDKAAFRTSRQHRVQPRVGCRLPGCQDFTSLLGGRSQCGLQRHDFFLSKMFTSSQLEETTSLMLTASKCPTGKFGL